MQYMSVGRLVLCLACLYGYNELATLLVCLYELHVCVCMAMCASACLLCLAAQRSVIARVSRPEEQSRAS